MFQNGWTRVICSRFDREIVTARGVVSSLLTFAGKSEDQTLLMTPIIK